MNCEYFRPSFWGLNVQHRLPRHIEGCERGVVEGVGTRNDAKCGADKKRRLGGRCGWVGGWVIQPVVSCETQLFLLPSRNLPATMMVATYGSALSIGSTFAHTQHITRANVSADDPAIWITRHLPAEFVFPSLPTPPP